MKLARDVEWLLKNGLRLDRNVSITQALAHGKNYKHDRIQSERLFLDQLAEEALAGTSPVFRQVIAGKTQPEKPASLCTRSMSHAVVFAYLMGVLYGSAENFYRSAYHSSTGTTL